MAEAISHIDGKYLDAFKEALLSLFDNPTTATQEEQYIEYIGETVCYDSSVDIVHIGFNDKELGEEWAHHLHHLENYGHRYIIEEAEHLPNYPLELKIKGVTIEDARTLNRIYNFSKLPDNIEYKESWKDDDYQSIEDIEREDPNNIVVYPYEVKNKEKPKLHLPSLPSTIGDASEGDAKEKTYFELTGRPDLRPEQYEDITPNITYSSSGRAYVGFNDYQEAEKFRELVSEPNTPTMLSQAEIMHSHEWEVKFYCARDYLEKVIELRGDPIYTDITTDIVYSSEGKCFIGFSSRARAEHYGALLIGNKLSL